MRDGVKEENEEVRLRQQCYPVLETDVKSAIFNTESYWIKVNQTDRGGKGVATAPFLRRFRD